MKLARKVTDRSIVGAFPNGFHGMTPGALAATGAGAKRHGAGLALAYVTRLPFRKVDAAVVGAGFTGTEALSQEMGSGRFFGGVLDEGSARLNPMRYLFGLARAVRRGGGGIAGRTPVASLEACGRGQFRLEHTRGRTEAGRGVVATNGYTGDLKPAPRRHVIPLGSYVVATEPLSEQERVRLTPHERVFMTYFRLTPDRWLLFGGRNDWSPDQNAEVSRRQSGARLRQVLPEFGRLEITHARGGRLGFSFDRRPHIGVIDDVHDAFGFRGHGVPTAAWRGKALAHRVPMPARTSCDGSR